MLFLSVLRKTTDGHIHSYQPRVKTSINLGSFQSFFFLSIEHNVAQFMKSKVNGLQIRVEFYT